MFQSKLEIESTECSTVFDIIFEQASLLKTKRALI